jgi:hypothetical protein
MTKLNDDELGQAAKAAAEFFVEQNPEFQPSLKALGYFVKYINTNNLDPASVASYEAAHRAMLAEHEQQCLNGRWLCTCSQSL